MTSHRAMAGWVLAVGLTACEAYAQPAEQAFDDLPRLVKVGDKINVKGADGRVTTGLVQAVSPAGLTLSPSVSAFAIRTPNWAPPAPVAFRAGEVLEVTRGGDRLWNGTAIGAAVALGLGLASVATATGDASDGVAALPALALMGAGAGLAIDWSIGRKQRVWSAGAKPGARASVVPALGRKAAGVSLSLQF